MRCCTLGYPFSRQPEARKTVGIIALGWNKLSNLVGKTIGAGLKKHRRWLEKGSNLNGTAIRTWLETTSHPVGRNIAFGWKRFIAKTNVIIGLHQAKGFRYVSEGVLLIVSLANNSTIRWGTIP